jgi:hypothetical protein
MVDINDLARRDGDPSKGWSSLGLALAKIIDVFPGEMRCTVQVIHGEGDLSLPLSGVELLMPSMGARHFLGGIPEIGDKCVVGWFVGDTDGPANNKTPAILAWWPPATYLGHDWLSTQSFKPGEGFDTLKKRQAVANHYQRTRYKLRQFRAGNIGASSAQGADIILDESVTLSNRRLNEIVLRDQDQAIVMRSLQQFHALAGARVYAGMVQRDARSLPKEMFSDGIKWDSSIQIDPTGKPYYPLEGMEEDSLEAGKLKPNPLFHRENVSLNEFQEAQGERAFKGDIPDIYDPYTFLYDAGLIDNQLFDETLEGITYGGKSVFRVGTKFSQNAVEQGQAFTEYRIEVNHTTDGVLPVTEQTDGFDSDRLQPTRPFIEWVLGTPVGNDPFSAIGRESYGLPLVPSISQIKTASSTTLFEDHAATLFRLTPTLPNLSDTFTSFTKGGKFRGFVSNPSDDAVTFLAEGGIDLASSNKLMLSANQVEVNSTESTELYANTLFIEGRGSRPYSPVDGDSLETSVSIKGSQRVELVSDTTISLRAPLVDLSQAQQVKFNSNSLLDLSSGAGLNISGERVRVTGAGSYEENISGPANANPLQGPAKRVRILATPLTGHPGGPSDSYTNAFGGREETYIGPATNTRTLSTATETTTIAAGSSTTTVSGNTQVIDTTGFKFASPAGKISATAGSEISLTSRVVSVQAFQSIELNAPRITLSSPGVATGAIICGSDIHPILGLPYETFALPRGQN